MPRARNIKPGFFKNDELAEIDMCGRLLFIGLWTLADREGRIADRPKRIKAELFPYDDVDVDKLLGDLQEHGFIRRYTAQGVKCIQVVNFLKHQNPHKNEVESELPAEEMNDSTQQGEDVSGTNREISGAVQDKSRNFSTSTVPILLNPSSLNPDTLNPDTLIPEPLENNTTTTGNSRARARSVEDNEPDLEWGDVVFAYSDNIRPVSGAIEKDRLHDLYAEYGKVWVIAAITEAVECSKGPPSMKYITAILDRWKREGFRSDGRMKRKPVAEKESPQLAMARRAIELIHGGADTG